MRYIKYLYRGKRLDLDELAKISGMNIRTLYGRLQKLPVEEAMIPRTNKATKYYPYKGGNISARDLSEIVGLKMCNVYNFLNRDGISADDIITKYKKDEN